MSEHVIVDTSDMKMFMELHTLCLFAAYMYIVHLVFTRAVCNVQPNLRLHAMS